MIYFMRGKGLAVSKSCGITLLELLVVLVIIGILAALGMPDFGKSSEKNKGIEAEANLQMIYNAQKRYYLENSQYYSCASVPCDIKLIDDVLGVNIAGDSFSYEISAAASPITAFSATAIRSGSDGKCSGQTMSITQEGGQISKGCAVW